jgi:hypothetical protein
MSPESHKPLDTHFNGDCRYLFQTISQDRCDSESSAVAQQKTFPQKCASGLKKAMNGDGNGQVQLNMGPRLETPVSQSWRSSAVM